MPDWHALEVGLGDRSYPIRVGRLDQLGLSVSDRLPPGRCFVVTNDVVGPLHAPAALASLERSGWTPELMVLPDGEAHKDLATWSGLVLELLDRGLDRKTPVVALGGGVTGDLTGFAAGTAMRGVPLVQVPTTLLAMVDSSVGGKTAVNTPHGKNLVGVFHQPVLVHAPLDTLVTLDRAELRCGLGEVVKHAVLADPAFFEWLYQEGAALIAGQEQAVRHAVLRCCAIKAEVVAEDEREGGRRAVLNLGHTVAHALERVLGYGTLRHGEAVAIGIVAECALAERRGAAGPGLARRVSALLVQLGLPTTAPPGADPQSLLDAVWMDKKMSRGRLTLTVPVDVGDVRLERVEPAEVGYAIRVAIGDEALPEA